MGKQNKAPKESGSKPKEEGIILEGIVTEALKNGFLVEILLPDGKRNPDNPHLVDARLAGKLRKNFIRIVSGDRVKVEVSPYDLTKGRITFRLK
jgi:translation initiation factor IF-1